MRTHTLILTFLFLLSSCEKEDSHSLKSVLDKNLILFTKNEIPSGLQSAFDNNKIIIFGERHYEQEHHEYIAYLLENISKTDFIFISELHQADNWIITDYINREIDYLPNHIRFYDNIEIEKIREINSNNYYSFSVQYFYMDVNHDKYKFKNSIIESEKILGNQIEFQQIKSLIPDSEEYRKELLSLQGQFETDDTLLIQKFGEKWYSRYKQMIDYEIKSSYYRLTGDYYYRDSCMADMVLKIIKNNPSKKVIINTGMNHALKGKKSMPSLAYNLNQEYPGNTYCISFYSIKGERITSDRNGEIYSFNFLTELENNDLIRIIGYRAGDNLSYLSLGDEIFENAMKFGNVFLFPSSKYDAIITYPDIHILESMSEYQY